MNRQVIGRTRYWPLYHSQNWQACRADMDVYVSLLSSWRASPEVGTQSRPLRSTRIKRSGRRPNLRVAQTLRREMSPALQV